MSYLDDLNLFRKENYGKYYNDLETEYEKLPKQYEKEMRYKNYLNAFSILKKQLLYYEVEYKNVELLEEKEEKEYEDGLYDDEEGDDDIFEFSYNHQKYDENSKLDSFYNEITVNYVIDNYFNFYLAYDEVDINYVEEVINYFNFINYKNNIEDIKFKKEALNIVINKIQQEENFVQRNVKKLLPEKYHALQWSSIFYNLEKVGRITRTSNGKSSYFINFNDNKIVNYNIKPEPLAETKYLSQKLKPSEKPIAGIYKIVNNLNKKLYIGQAVDIERRWKQHKMDFEEGVNKRLYKAFKEFGIENFTFEIVEEVDIKKYQKEEFKDILNRLEAKYIRENNTEDENIGYNAHPTDIMITLDPEYTTNKEDYDRSIKLRNTVSSFLEKYKDKIEEIYRSNKK